MEIKRTSRTVVASVMAIGIALGGFYTGYAKSGPVKPPVAKEVQPSYLGKLPINLNYTLVVYHPNDFGISQDVVAKVREACKSELAQYFVAQKKEYEYNLANARLAEEGKIMSWTFRPGVFDVQSLRKLENDQKLMTEAWGKLSVKVAQIIGKEKNAKVVQKLNQYRSWDRIGQDADLMLDPAVLSELNLSQVQRNQLILVTAGMAEVVANPSAKDRKDLDFDEIAPQYDQYRKVVSSAKTPFKSYFYGSAISLLSPLQKLQLDIMIRNREYVQP